MDVYSVIREAKENLLDLDETPLSGEILELTETPLKKFMLHFKNSNESICLTDEDTDFVINGIKVERN